MIKKLVLFTIFLLLLSGCSKSANFNPDGLNGETIITENFLIQVDRGKIAGATMVHKFGANPSVSTTLVPVTISGNYQTPTTVQSLEILSANAADTALGIGARTVKVIGLNATGEEISEIVTMNGTTPVPLTKQFLRVYRMYVFESGTYATQTTPSHLGIITLRSAGAGPTWAIINVVTGGFGAGQTEIGAYTTPKDTTCLLLSKTMSVDSIRSADLYFFQRPGILNTTAPYQAMRIVEKHIGLTGVFGVGIANDALNIFPELTDIGFLAKSTSGTAAISAEFDLLCLNNNVFSNLILEIAN